MHTPPRTAQTATSHRQRGSMAVPMLLMLLGLISMLGLVEVGYLYWAKRDAQKVADLAALSGVQQLSEPACPLGSPAYVAASGNASDNGGTPENGFTSIDISCGRQPASGSSVLSLASAGSAVAIKVVVNRDVNQIWGKAWQSKFPVKAEAVAINSDPIAAFSVGTTLVKFNGESTLGGLLRGVGIPLDGTSLVGYEGLANVQITPAGLLKQLGVEVPTDITVGDLNALLSSELQAHALIDVLDAIVTVAGQQDLANANVSLLHAITTTIPGISLQNVTLGSATNSPGGLFAHIVAPDGAAQAALNAQVNALQLISTAIGVGTGRHAVETKTGVKLGNLLNVTAATSVIEPPSIGIGGVGTTAYTAQIRTFIHLKLDTGDIPLIGGLIKLQLDLPMALDLVTAQATLTDLCTTTNSEGLPQATIAVDAPILKMCVGNITQANAFSTAAGCDQIPGANTPQQLFKLRAAGVDLASLNTSFAINPLSANGEGELIAGQTAILPEGGNQLAIGTTVNSLFKTLLVALIANPDTQPSADSSTTANQTATDLWKNTNTSLNYAKRTQQALDEIRSASNGLQGLLGSTTGSVVDILGNTLQLNVPELLGGVGNLLGGVTDAVSGLLNNLVCTLGSKDACINVISGALNNGGSGSNSSAFIGLLGFLVQTLQAPLDDLGSKVLTPLLRDTLGLSLGQNTVHMQSLQCHRAQLVY